MNRKGFRTAAAVLLLVSITATLAACGTNQSPQSSGNAAAGDSSAVSGNVSTNGSTSMESVIGILSEQFMLDNSKVKVTYDATGSGTGIEAAGNGTCDIGLSSRDLTDAEKAKGLTQTTIAKDGIVMIVNKNSAVSDLSLEQIASIYKGDVKNWSEVGGSDLAIACIGREAGSGTRDGFETITGTKGVCVLSQELTSTGAVIEAVKNSENAIGYTSFSAVEDQPDIKVLTVGGVSCTEDTIADDSYAIQRDFNLITRNGVKLSAAAQAFFNYITSDKAYGLIRKTGVVPAGK